MRSDLIRRYRLTPHITGRVPVPSDLNGSKPSSRKATQRSVQRVNSVLPRGLYSSTYHA